MRRRLAVLWILPVALAACGGSGSLRQQTTSSTTPRPKVEVAAITIKVISVLQRARPHDSQPAGASRGDWIDQQGLLLNGVAQFGRAVNSAVGTDSARLTFTSSHTARMRGVAKLPDGTIRFNGKVTLLPNHRVSIPVVGGTGTYQDAVGTLLVGAGTRRAVNTYSLSVPVVAGPIV